MLDTCFVGPHGAPLIRLPHTESQLIPRTQGLSSQALRRLFKI
jgi:hypothetical protein